MVAQPAEIGLAELRQNASDLVRRVEGGAEFVVTVSGRPAARLVAVTKKTWLAAAELEPILVGMPPWGERDRDDAVDDSFDDPWDRAGQQPPPA